MKHIDVQLSNLMVTGVLGRVGVCLLMVNVRYISARMWWCSFLMVNEKYRSVRMGYCIYPDVLFMIKVLGCGGVCLLMVNKSSRSVRRC